MHGMGRTGMDQFTGEAAQLIRQASGPLHLNHVPGLPGARLAA